MSYGFLNKQGAASAGSADADTPILCESCLGPNPYVRMSKQHLGQECEICARPFTVFRWNPGSGMRFKKTEICTTCAKLKNACQSCILDLQYHLPTQVRDAALGSSVKIPMSDINRQYFVNRMDALLEGTDTETTIGPTRAHPEWLTKMASHEPDYKRNRPPVCSFYARGTCTRGEACPYRHEPTGSSAPTSSVPPALAPPRPKAEAPALRLQKAAGAKPLAAPANPSIKSIFFTGLPDVTAEELQALLVASIPRLTAEDVAEVKMVSASHCAFVVFATREKAEQVAEALAMKMDIKGKDVRVAWSRK